MRRAADVALTWLGLAAAPTVAGNALNSDMTMLRRSAHPIRAPQARRVSLRAASAQHVTPPANNAYAAGDKPVTPALGTVCRGRVMGRSEEGVRNFWMSKEEGRRRIRLASGQLSLWHGATRRRHPWHEQTGDLPRS
jgi:hypothetical protein